MYLNNNNKGKGKFFRGDMMKKRILTILLVMIVAVTNIVPVYATSAGGIEEIGLGNYTGTIGEGFSADDGKGGEPVTGISKPLDNSSGLQKAIAILLGGIFGLLVDGVKWLVFWVCPMMDIIVFNDPTAYASGGQTLEWGSLCRLTYFDTYGLESEQSLAISLTPFVSAFYQIFRYIALIGFVVSIVAVAVKMIISSIGKQKQQYKELLKKWLTGLVLLVVGHWIMIYMIYFSDYLVKLLFTLKNSIFTEGMFIGNDIDTLGEIFSVAINKNIDGAWFLVVIWATMAIVAILMFAVMNIKILKVYLERVIVVGVLIMIFPLVTVFYAFEKTGLKKGDAFGSWLRTFIDQVFIQPVHALAMIGVMIALAALTHTNVIDVPIIGMIIVLMVLNTMFTIESTIKKVFSISGAAMGSAINPVAPMMGAAAIGAVATGKLAGKAIKGAAGLGKGILGKKEGTTFKDRFKSGSESVGKFGSTVRNNRAVSFVADQVRSKDSAMNQVLGLAGLGAISTLATAKGREREDKGVALKDQIAQSKVNKNMRIAGELKVKLEETKNKPLGEPKIPAVPRNENGQILTDSASRRNWVYDMVDSSNPHMSEADRNKVVSQTMMAIGKTSWDEKDYAKASIAMEAFMDPEASKEKFGFTDAEVAQIKVGKADASSVVKSHLDVAWGNQPKFEREEEMSQMISNAYAQIKDTVTPAQEAKLGIVNGVPPTLDQLAQVIAVQAHPDKIEEISKLSYDQIQRTCMREEKSPDKLTAAEYNMPKDPNSVKSDAVAYSQAIAELERRLAAVSLRMGDEMDSALSRATQGMVTNMEQAFAGIQNGSFGIEQFKRTLYALDNKDEFDADVSDSFINDYVKSKSKSKSKK